MSDGRCSVLRCDLVRLVAPRQVENPFINGIQSSFPHTHTHTHTHRQSLAHTPPHGTWHAWFLLVLLQLSAVQARFRSEVSSPSRSSFSLALLQLCRWHGLAWPGLVASAHAHPHVCASVSFTLYSTQVDFFFWRCDGSRSGRGNQEQEQEPRVAGNRLPPSQLEVMRPPSGQSFVI